MLNNPRFAFIQADWSLDGVQAGSTTRHGGSSEPPYDSLNLASHVEDEPTAVADNRACLKRALQLPAEPVWLEQVHGNVVIDAASARGIPRADASFTTVPGIVCAVLTADCLPVLFARRDGSAVAAAHAGWRGLAAGVLEATVDSLVMHSPCRASDIVAWLGPAIAADAFEVGDDVFATFHEIEPALDEAFEASRPGHWQADIYQLGRGLLNRCGVSEIHGGGLCTYHDDRFYSYRQQARTGRMASLIWMD
jgi:YfiH family protein